MKTIGIITIHKINNYGSVLQAFALQYICEELGYKVEVIDYSFPNDYHKSQNSHSISSTQLHGVSEPLFIKLLFAYPLLKQHNAIAKFINQRLHLSKKSYDSPKILKENAPQYDIYITGSDQVWNPQYCKGDPSYMLHFAPDEALKISYAASIGTDSIPDELYVQYESLLRRYSKLSVREASGKNLISSLTDNEVSVVMDPTLLLNKTQWNKIATLPYLVHKKKYILCYFLNYSFNAFPYVEDLAKDIQKQTGFEIVWVARPPHQLKIGRIHYEVGASPEEFLALIRDAEIVLTTSFHGTAFALNFGRPVFTVVKDRNTRDSRQSDLMKSMGLENHIISISDGFPDYKEAFYDSEIEQVTLNQLRKKSIDFLKNSLQG